MYYCPDGQTADDETYSPCLFEPTIDGTSRFGRRVEAGQDVLHDIVGCLFLVDGAKRAAERVQFRYILVLRVCVFRERERERCLRTKVVRRDDIRHPTG